MAGYVFAIGGDEDPVSMIRECAEKGRRIVKSSATQYHKRPHREISNLNIFWGGGS